jgi:chromosomal replication initiation ATPase DnaA
MAADHACARQLPLPFEPARSFHAADFVEGAANAEARAWLGRWPAWPLRRLALWGPAGSGKSHLAAIWRARAGAVPIEGAALADADPAAVIGGLPPGASAVIEDADAVAGRDRALLHLLNAVAEGGGSLLLTGRLPPARWQASLPDLRSRLAATAAVAIAAPDEALVAAVLAKLLADRQVDMRPDLLEWLAVRLPRDFSTVHALAAELDAASLAAGRRVTRPIAAASLARALSDTGHAPARDEGDDKSVEAGGDASPPRGPVL